MFCFSLYIDVHHQEDKEMIKTRRLNNHGDNNECLMIIIPMFLEDIYLVYLPQICNIKTLAIKIKLMTRTGTGPTLRPGESSV